MKAVVIILSIIIFTACLIIGIQAGNAALPGEILQPAPSDQPVPSTGGQRTILLISVDDLTYDNPRLVGVWVLFYRPGYPQLSALALYPQKQLSPAAAGVDLPGAFGLALDRSLTAEFTAELQKYHFAWDGILVIDKTGTRNIIDWLGGIDLQGGHVDGTTALDSIQDPWSDYTAALEDQAGLGRALCTAAAQRDENADWAGLIPAIEPGHLATSLSGELLANDLKDLVTAEHPFLCEFPEASD